MSSLAPFTLVIRSPFPNVSHWLEDQTAQFYSDVDVVLAGDDKPLHLHRVCLGSASKVFDSLFRLKESAHGKLNTESHIVEWKNVFDSSEDDTYRIVFHKLLRFCYGSVLKLETNECCAALAALSHLDLTCREEMQQEIESYMINTAKNDVEEGLHMINECMKYEECHSEIRNRVDFELVKCVMSRKNLMEHKVLCMDCLMTLPSEYLDVVEYSELHGKTSEFSIRRRYIEENKRRLSKEQQRAIMTQCRWEKLNNSELRELEETGLLGKDYMLEVYRVVQQKTEERCERLQKKCDELEKRLKQYYCSDDDD